MLLSPVIVEPLTCAKVVSLKFESLTQCKDVTDYLLRYPVRVARGGGSKRSIRRVFAYASLHVRRASCIPRRLRGLTLSL